MKLNFLVPIISALVLGYLCATYVVHEYDTGKVSKEDEITYFLQIASYDNIESSLDDFKDINNKLTIKENNKYYTYIGITRDKEMALKIKDLYKEKEIDVYIKNVVVDNNDFLNELEQYDILLKNCNNLEEINSVLKTILATFEENLNNS